MTTEEKTEEITWRTDSSRDEFIEALAETIESNHGGCDWDQIYLSSIIIDQLTGWSDAELLDEAGREGLMFMAEWSGDEEDTNE